KNFASDHVWSSSLKRRAHVCFGSYLRQRVLYERLGRSSTKKHTSQNWRFPRSRWTTNQRECARGNGNAFSFSFWRSLCAIKGRSTQGCRILRCQIWNLRHNGKAPSGAYLFREKTRFTGTEFFGSP